MSTTEQDELSKLMDYHSYSSSVLSPNTRWMSQSKFFILAETALLFICLWKSAELDGE